jgi:hypothetical protein
VLGLGSLVVWGVVLVLGVLGGVGVSGLPRLQGCDGGHIGFLVKLLDLGFLNGQSEAEAESRELALGKGILTVY